VQRQSGFDGRKGGAIEEGMDGSRMEPVSFLMDPSIRRWRESEAQGKQEALGCATLQKT